MKNISKQFLLAVMSAGILFSSCKKSFLDINDNPNQPTDANMTAELIFPSAADIKTRQPMLPSPMIPVYIPRSAASKNITSPLH